LNFCFFDLNGSPFWLAREYDAVKKIFIIDGASIETLKSEGLKNEKEIKIPGSKGNAAVAGVSISLSRPL
jgi:hypothetical protein